jgi:hypothetical protein
MIISEKQIMLLMQAVQTMAFRYAAEGKHEEANNLIAFLLDTGVEIYQQKYGNCQRCGKSIKGIKSTHEPEKPLDERVIHLINALMKKVEQLENELKEIN